MVERNLNIFHQFCFPLPGDVNLVDILPDIMKTLSKILVTAGAVSVASTAYLLYKLLSSSEEEDDDEEEKRQSATSKQTIIELEVPAKAAGGIIGRQGSNIKEIQKNTGTRINFKDDGSRSKDDDDGKRTMVIRGTAESAQKAELIIREFVANMPVVLTEQIFVPSSALGRIIGRGGETIRSISRSANARVYIDRTKDEYRDIDREVQITGTREQIDLAKTLIEEKLQEEKVFRAKKSVMEANRERRNKSKVDNEEEKREELPLDKVKQVQKDSNLHIEKICSWPSGREYVEVYVSSVANPSTFFVQILTSMSIELDELVKDMSQYFSKEREVDVPKTVSVGDLVAAPFDQDNSWYRARVCGFHGDDLEELDLFYLDYGDSCYLPRSKVRILQSDFLRIPFQAVECEMANVCPTDGDTWDEVVVDKFEQLTYSAMWKVLMARLVEIKTLSTGERIHIVELVDTNGETDINIGKKLCDEGLARWCKIKEDS